MPNADCRLLIDLFVDLLLLPPTLSEDSSCDNALYDCIATTFLSH